MAKDFLLLKKNCFSKLSQNFSIKPAQDLRWVGGDGAICNLCCQILIRAANYIKNKVALDLAKSTAPGPKPSAQYVHKRPFAKGHINVNCLMMIMSLESEAPSLHLSSQMTKKQLTVCHLCPNKAITK